eukprot:COSAG03_NODE_25763_length_263_cov_1.250000_1_plen_40_part_01
MRSVLPVESRNEDPEIDRVAPMEIAPKMGNGKWEMGNEID